MGGDFVKCCFCPGPCQTFSFILLSPGVTLCVFGLQTARGTSERENVFTHADCLSARVTDTDPFKAGLPRRPDRMNYTQNTSEETKSVSKT